MTKQCSSCGGDCGRTKKTGCRYRGNEMNTDRELLQQVLDAFNLYAEQYPHMIKGYMLDAAQAIRARLAQPEQSTWIGISDDEIDTIYWGAAENDLLRAREIEAKLKEKNATPQPAQKPLTDGQIIDLYEEHDDRLMSGIIEFARAIETAHNIKEMK